MREGAVAAPHAPLAPPAARSSPLHAVAVQGYRQLRIVGWWVIGLVGARPARPFSITLALFELAHRWGWVTRASDMDAHVAHPPRNDRWTFLTPITAAKLGRGCPVPRSVTVGLP